MRDFQTLLSRSAVFVLLLLLFTLSIVGCNDSDETQGTVTIKVSMTWEGKPLQLNESFSTEFGGLVIEDFKFYLSNLNLQGSNRVFVEADSYHLVKANENGDVYEIILENVPEGTYDQLTYGIGVDPEKNLSIDNDGDLDPTNQMAWNWDTGYKFILFEGKLNSVDQGVIPLVYHIGFSENYYETEEEIQPITITSGGEVEITLNVKVEQMFLNPNRIDWFTVNNVMFNKEEVSLFVENYKNGMFSLE